ncbi:SCO4225 family membrane protein [Rhizohabitans arisaemae]|uniref:SCO4225 family membrane protein n=1 Tax=Rhizohabitans arisaemae TaxID=2720610 RepID=UPI0024B136D6|nr:hypothetical protein [Rhizohabitans arisaemae]
MRNRTRTDRRGRFAALVAGGYGVVVLALGLYSAVILLTVQDPILLSGVALIAVTVPLGWLIAWLWDLLLIDVADPLLLMALLTLAGLFQAWLLWYLLRRFRSVRVGPDQR